MGGDQEYSFSGRKNLCYADGSVLLCSAEGVVSCNVRAVLVDVAGAPSGAVGSSEQPRKQSHYAVFSNQSFEMAC